MALAVPSLVDNGRDPRVIGRDYPALLVVFLTEFGVRHYESNDFWTRLRWSQSQRARAGEAFEDALVELGLERFAQFFAPGSPPAKRFVSVILAHGGLPRSFARRFVHDVLLPAMRRGEGNTGEELVGAWRAHPPAAVPTTVARFLLHGGATTVDLVDRLIDALRSAPGTTEGGELGLPGHLAAVVRDLPADARAGLGTLLPRPRIELDPYAGVGPQLVLPALERELARAVRWRVDSGAGVSDHPGRIVGDEHVELAPASWWRISASGPGVAPLDLVRECFGATGIVCFDGQTGAFLPHTTGLRAGDAWIIADAGVTLCAPDGDALRPLVPAETSALRGGWGACSLARYALGEAEILVLLRSGIEQTRVPITHNARPELVGEQVRDVRGLAGGEPVYAEPPSLYLPAWGVWTVEVTEVAPDGTPADRRAFEVDASDAGRTVPLAVAGRLAFGRHEISARGAIGSDLHAAYVVVPGLVVEAPLTPLRPGAGAIAVPARATAPVALAGRPVGEPVAVDFEADAVTAGLWAWLGRDHKVGLLARIPRVRWAFRPAATPPPLLTDVRFVLDPAPLAPGDAVVIEAGRAGRWACLDLLAPDGEPIQEGELRPARESGRLEISLDRFLDTLGANPAATLAVRLDGDRIPITSPPRPVAPPARAAAPQQPSVGLRRGQAISALVVAVRLDQLVLEADGVRCRAFPERLPQPLDAYASGERVSAWVLNEGPEPRLDLRPFDAARFGRGETVPARVARTNADSVWFSLGDMDGRARAFELPPGRTPESYRAGEDVEVMISGPDEPARRWRLTLAPALPARLARGLVIEGRVRIGPPPDVYLDLGDAVGAIEATDLPDGRLAGSFRTGERLVGTVLRLDRNSRLAWCTLRPFNPSAHALGDQVEARVVWSGPVGLNLRLADGAPAFVRAGDFPLGRSAGPAAYPRGASVAGRIIGLDSERFSILISLRPLDATYTSGDANAEESPFGVLRGRVRR